MTIQPLIKQLEEIEKGYGSILDLCAIGAIMSYRDHYEAGDFDLSEFNHPMCELLTIGFVKRVRYDGNPFPRHLHKNEKVWLICCEGSAIIDGDVGQRSNQLIPGNYVFIEPQHSHLLCPADNEPCTLLFISFPAEECFLVKGNE